MANFNVIAIGASDQTGRNDARDDAVEKAVGGVLGRLRKPDRG